MIIIIIYQTNYNFENHPLKNKNIIIITLKKYLTF